MALYTSEEEPQGGRSGRVGAKITLGWIANNEEPEMVTLVDRPSADNTITRVCGRFTVEATIQAAMSLDEKTATTQR